MDDKLGLKVKLSADMSHAKNHNSL